MLGPQDLAIGLVIVLVLFGAKRLPELAGSLGKSMKEFKKAVEGADAPSQRACPSCQGLLEPDWQHCPRCGSAVPPAPTP